MAESPNILGDITGGIVSAGVQTLGNVFLQDRANKQNIEFWNKENEYNKPINQMARLAEAGLNPNLVYGNGSVVGNTAGGIAPARPAELGKLADYQEIKMNNAGLERIHAQNELTNAQADVAKATGEGVKMDNIVKAGEIAILKKLQEKGLSAKTNPYIQTGLTGLEKITDQFIGGISPVANWLMGVGGDTRTEYVKKREQGMNPPQKGKNKR